MTHHNFPSGLPAAGCYEEMTSDGELLRRYAASRSEDAFAEIVRRHLDLVYSSALRQVNGDAHAAQDVAQTVFRDLAIKASALSSRESLTGWLYTSTHFAAAKTVRAECRRRAREQEAHAMRELLHAPADNPDWDKLRPVLDEVMHELKAPDREVILMRYFENRPLASIGQQLGLGEDAARKRVDRAVEKLRLFLLRRGVAANSGLAAVLSVNAVQLAPSGLTVTLTTTSLAAAAGSGSSLALWKLFAMTKLKLTAVSALVIAGVTTPLVLQHQSQTRLREQIRSLQADVDDLARLKVENDRLQEMLAQSRAAAATGSNQLNELLRLRGEVGVLRQQTNDLERLQAENRRLRAAPRSTPGEASEPIPRDQWTFMGYTTPEATAQSLLWALKDGGTNAYRAYLDGLVPELRARTEREAERRGGVAAFAELGVHETGSIAEYRIVGTIPLTDDRVLVRVQPGEGLPIQSFVMRKIGEEWKMGDEIK